MVRVQGTGTVCTLDGVFGARIFLRTDKNTYRRPPEPGGCPFFSPSLAGRSSSGEDEDDDRVYDAGAYRGPCVQADGKACWKRGFFYMCVWLI